MPSLSSWSPVTAVATIGAWFTFSALRRAVTTTSSSVSVLAVEAGAVGVVCAPAPAGRKMPDAKTAAITILAEMAERLRQTNSLLSQRATKDVVKEIEENLTWGQRLADKVAELNGSWAFILFLLGLSLAWSAVNQALRTPFDAYPYQFYNLFLAVLVALQGPLIVMSQNRQSLKDRATAETDFNVNLKNEIGIERLLAELSSFRAESDKRLEALERGMRNERVRSEIPAKSPGGPLERRDA